MSDEYRNAVGMMWLSWRDLAAELAPFLNREGMYRLISNLRADAGSGSFWAGIHEPWAAQRDLLRFRLIEIAEANGEPWPFLEDLPPAPPADVSELL
jgi:hypothetical protein